MEHSSQKQKGHRDGCSDSGSAPLLWDRDSGFNSTTATLNVLCSGYLACGAFLSCWSEELRDEKKKKYCVIMRCVCPHCFHMKAVNHCAYPTPRTEHDVIFCQRTCHIIVISTSSNRLLPHCYSLDLEKT